MYTCKKCKCSKAKGEMSLWGGEISEICLDCRKKMKAERGGGDSSKPTKAAKDAKPAPADEPAATDDQLVVHAGLGFSAAIDGENLVVSQANPNREDDPDNLTLSKSEAYVLIKKFAPWAGVELKEVA